MYALFYGTRLFHDHDTSLHGRRIRGKLIDKIYQFDFMILLKSHGMLNCDATKVLIWAQLLKKT
ncbi:MAG: hypothetical protein DRH17_01850 [Deltaproteobacteria bacterium]|nr:MAG: hypothetical protein DRH17_01850 [Deltaproteobacteria bacterium]